MLNVNEDWYPKYARLKSIILNPDFFDEAIGLALELHALVHAKEVSTVVEDTFADEVFNSVSDKCFNSVTYDKGRTFAYNIWHITRIEDICSNILIAEDSQIINSNEWLNKLNSTIMDTGNALSAEEIIDFSLRIDRQQLFKYRIAVGQKTQKILGQLKPDDMKRKMNPAALSRILDEKAVSAKEDAIWLVDFWGRKNVAGLILMPLTKHHVMHLNNCLRIKSKCK